MRKIIMIAGLAAALGSAVTAQALSMSTDEQTLRARLVSCAILDAGAERGISESRLPLTRLQCSRVR